MATRFVGVLTLAFLAACAGCKSQSQYRAAYTQPAVVQAAPACPTPAAVVVPPPPGR